MNETFAKILICISGFFAMFLPLYLLADAGISPLYGTATAIAIPSIQRDFSEFQPHTELHAEEYPTKDVTESGDTTAIAEKENEPEPIDNDNTGTDVDTRPTSEENQIESFSVAIAEVPEEPTPVIEPGISEDAAPVGILQDAIDNGNALDNIDQSDTKGENPPPTRGGGGGGGDASNFDTWNIPEQQLTSNRYVINISSMKVHHPLCPYVQKIAPENYETSNLTISELEAQGYSRCKQKAEEKWTWE